MAEKGSAISTLGKLFHFSIRFLYKLTVSLVLELLKFGVLSLILVGLVFGLVISLVYAAHWSYSTSGGSIFYTVGVVIGVFLTTFLAFGALQFVVRDVLKLTDMTMVDVVFLWLRMKETKSAPDSTDKSNQTDAVISDKGQPQGKKKGI